MDRSLRERQTKWVLTLTYGTRIQPSAYAQQLLQENVQGLYTVLELGQLIEEHQAQYFIKL
ncbi:hypothetical protein DNI29_23315 [Hymenobacter sediminis]|uniref:hypothetical protein n=1 Tax=Hymenobacter sediminis TaxID=2218621 RepID=UPI000DA64297|nr:hypothetical protein [Hymenobacter sediminis]RPD43669.1 hypothetical protein DNI29_23315 [Hymenobacter sediminis]